MNHPDWDVLFTCTMYQNLCQTVLLKWKQAWSDSPLHCYVNKLARLLPDLTWVTAPSSANACIYSSFYIYWYSLLLIFHVMLFDCICLLLWGCCHLKHWPHIVYNYKSHHYHVYTVDINCWGNLMFCFWYIMYTHSHIWEICGWHKVHEQTVQV